MSSVLCEEQQKLLLNLKKSLTMRDNIIDNIPPRKLLTRRQSTNTSADMFSEEDPYSSDHFRMYEFKIRRCTRSRSHDWTDCPFAHPGEKARRRDPLRFQYSGEVCPDYRRGNCDRGDACEFSHGVFESWLHPSRYRTEACKDGKNCKRKICFFAHTPRQLRVLLLPPPPSPPPQNNVKNCCSFCHCCSNSSSSSPTSTLLSGPYFSSANSPPLSPLSNSNPKDVHVLSELIRSMESFNFGGDDSPVSAGKYYSSSGSTSSKFLREEQRINVVDDDVSANPDFGWVNELLM
ncbi:zinc finger CCCH domain-containing protein 61-like [Vicia villosa]|uniref:zinc finger CCCH domain-containing protein 61-like n=1 Tax=Vicia villosa TaxID=3911 RepID=UPI00273BB831|nr:zinc finger CCCH domain-containing protein 61-like [Vicia villosa]